jgi:hypothetical protein
MFSLTPKLLNCPDECCNAAHTLTDIMFSVITMSVFILNIVVYYVVMLNVVDVLHHTFFRNRPIMNNSKLRIHLQMMSLAR